MSKRKDAWNTKENAQKYDAYVSEFSLYKETSKDLVSFAKAGAGMKVLDLPAGTGATTEALIERFGEDLQIIAVDQAGEMLKKAKEKFSKQKNIQYIISQAENVDENTITKVDLVVCNSAFWQMVPKKTLEAVSNILKEGGVFIFNLPDSFFQHEDFKRTPRRVVSYDFDDLFEWGKEHSLNLVDYAIKSYRKNTKEIAAFNEIPVMQRNFPDEKSREDHGFTRGYLYFLPKYYSCNLLVPFLLYFQRQLLIDVHHTGR